MSKFFVSIPVDQTSAPTFGQSVSVIDLVVNQSTSAPPKFIDFVSVVGGENHKRSNLPNKKEVLPEVIYHQHQQKASILSVTTSFDHTMNGTTNKTAIYGQAFTPISIGKTPFLLKSDTSTKPTVANIENSTDVYNTTDDYYYYYDYTDNTTDQYLYDFENLTTTPQALLTTAETRKIIRAPKHPPPIFSTTTASPKVITRKVKTPKPVQKRNITEKVTVKAGNETSNKTVPTLNTKKTADSVHKSNRTSVGKSLPTTAPKRFTRKIDIGQLSDKLDKLADNMADFQDMVSDMAVENSYYIG